MRFIAFIFLFFALFHFFLSNFVAFCNNLAFPGSICYNKTDLNRYIGGDQ